MKIKFCISTNGKKQFITHIAIASIVNTCKKSNILFEIIICGNSEPFEYLKNNDFIKLINHKHEADSGQLAKLRNLAVIDDNYDCVVFLDDDIIFDSNWAKNLLIYNSNNNWQILGNKILMPNHDRYWDRAVIRLNGLHHMVDYDYHDNDPELYQTGCFWILKKEIYDIHKWDSNIAYYAAHHGGVNEDVEYSRRLSRNGYRFKFDKNNLVWHWDEQYREFHFPNGHSTCEKLANPQPMIYSYDFLNLLTELGVQYQTLDQ